MAYVESANTARMKDVKDMLENISSWVSGRATPLQKCIDEEGGIQNLVDALLTSYRATRDEIAHEYDEEEDIAFDEEIDEKTGGFVYIERKLTEEELKRREEFNQRQIQADFADFDESVSFFEAALYCMITICSDPYRDDDSAYGTFEDFSTWFKESGGSARSARTFIQQLSHFTMFDKKLIPPEHIRTITDMLADTYRAIDPSGLLASDGYRREHEDDLVADLGLVVDASGKVASVEYWKTPSFHQHRDGSDDSPERYPDDIPEYPGFLRAFPIGANPDHLFLLPQGTYLLFEPRDTTVRELEGLVEETAQKRLARGREFDPAYYAYMERICTYYEDSGEEDEDSGITIYQPVEMKGFMYHMDKDVNDMVDAYLRECKYSLTCDEETYSMVREHLDTASRKIWKAFKERQEA